MSYNKTTWSNGDVITAAGLNNIESGISSAVVIVNPVMEDDTMSLPVKAGELYEACEYGAVVRMYLPVGGTTYIYDMSSFGLYDYGYGFEFAGPVMNYMFIASTADDYPTFTEDQSEPAV